MLCLTTIWERNAVAVEKPRHDVCFETKSEVLNNINCKFGWKRRLIPEQYYEN